MPWRRADFKGKRIWAQVDEKGALIKRSNLVDIRYGRYSGAKVYRGSASSVALESDAPIETLDEGTAASSPSKPAAKSTKGSGFGKAGERTEQQKAMAQDAAESLINSFEKNVVLCFTDGACKGNPGPAGSGVYVKLPDGRRGEASRSLGKGTNNIAELTAIELALDLLEEAEIGDETEVALFTDSSYSNGVLTKGWKAKANKELIANVRERLTEWPTLKIYWIAGHVGVDGNERADELANLGVDGITNTSWQSA